MAEKQQTSLYAATHGHSEPVLRTHQWRTVHNSAAYVLPHLTPSMKILDVGCGPGTITTDLATLAHAGHVTGLDYAEAALISARAHAAAEHVPNVDFIHGDAYALRFPDNTFDLVHAHQVLQHLGDPVSALREMRRVTKPGGLVACREGDRDAIIFYPDNDGLDIWWRTNQAMSKRNGGDAKGGRRLHVWARQAGFERAAITCSTGSWCFSSPEERQFWGGIIVDRMEQSSFAPNAIREGLLTAEEVERMKQGAREWILDEDGWCGLLHAEIICRKEL